MDPNVPPFSRIALLHIVLVLRRSGTYLNMKGNFFHDNIFYIYPQSSRTEFFNKSIASELIVL